MLKRSLSVFVLLAAVMVAPGSPSTAATQMTPFQVQVKACVAGAGTDRATRLVAGQQRIHAAPGVTVVWGAGLKVSTTHSPTGEGSVTVQAADGSNAALLAERYVAQGRSVVGDARAAGVSAGFLTKLCVQQVSRATADKSSGSSVLATAATTLANAGG